MQAPLKELDKLQKLTSSSPYTQTPNSRVSLLSASSLSSSKGKQTSNVSDSLDVLLSALRDIKERIEAGTASELDMLNLSRMVDEKRGDVDERQKEIHGSLGRIGKALDKKFTNPLPESPPLFVSPEAHAALQRSIALHFLRTGQFETAKTFNIESDVTITADTADQFLGLHEVIIALRNHDIEPALLWCAANNAFLMKRRSPLVFNLHRSRFVHLLLSSDSYSAIRYARIHLKPFYDAYGSEVNRLLASIVYLPVDRLRNSPYSDLASPSIHLDLEPLFSKEYCANLGMSRQVPLRIVGDIGGGGALARIEKGRKVMRERKSEWTQADELPIEIPLAPENRYHSIFACPVSKEQATTQNPPMMLTCGHVVAKDSLAKLAKPQGRAKCPYCPQEFQQNTAVEVHF